VKSSRRTRNASCSARQDSVRRAIEDDESPEASSPEVAGREATQVEHRQHVADLRRAPCVARQDPRAKAPALAGLGIDTAIIHTRRAQRHRARADRQLALLGAAVAPDQAPAALVELLDERSDVLLDLGLERRRDHAPSTLAGELVEPDPLLVLLPDGEPANISHGVPSCRPSPASVLTTGKVRRLLLQARPQHLGIALACA
jgi:hypothetical protein